MNYQDYLAAIQKQQELQRGNDMSGGAEPMGQQQWDAMPQQQRGSLLDWLNVTNGGSHADASQPQIDAFLSKFGGTNDGGFTTSYDGTPTGMKSAYRDFGSPLTDPSQVYTDANGQSIWRNSNVDQGKMAGLRADNARESASGNGFTNAIKAIIAAGGAFVGAGASGMLGGAGEAGSLAAEGTGAFDMGGSQGVFDSFGNGLYSSPPPEGYWGQSASNGNHATDAMGSENYAPVSDLSTPAASQPPAPVSDLSTYGSGTGLRGLMGNLAGGNYAQAGQGLLSGIMSNPLQAYSALQIGSGLLNHGGSKPASSSGGKSGGGQGLPSGNLDLSRPNYTPNPYLLAQLQRNY